MEERRAKIVATLGPASYDEAVLEKMIQAGMNIARLNFSHGTHSDHEVTFKKIRSISQRLGKPIAVMQDLQGVKIRTGDIQPVLLTPGDQVILTTTSPTPAGQISVDYHDLHKHVHTGGTILVDDGKMELLITAVEGKQITCEVVIGGLLKPHKGINLPGSRLDIPGFTEKDMQDLAFGLRMGVDAVAVSFVSKAEDIARVRRAVLKTNPRKESPMIIAKLERPEAVENLDEIIQISDGVMIARGDLGVEMKPEQVPIIQKEIIQRANQNQKIVITATQMLESMIHTPRPTRAEATDVANAIFDGTDAVMLSGETAVGDFPVKTIQMMDAIICQSEDHLKDWGRWQGTQSDQYFDDAIAITGAARELAHDLNVAAIVVFTQSGRTARFMSKALPRVPIIGFTPNESTYRQMSFYWGVFPYMIPMVNTVEEMLVHVDTTMVAASQIKDGVQVVVISGFPVATHRLPNLALLHTIGK